MTDVFSKTKRSDIMKAIGNKDSKIEIIFRKALWRKGFRYRKNPSNYFGRPDLVLKKYRTVIFIDSCFWHGCKKHFRIPSSNYKYWNNKINNNRNRDREVNKYYKINKWNVARIWEHDLKK